MGTQFRKNADFHWPVSTEWTPWVNESEFAAASAVDMLLVAVWAMNVLVLYHFNYIFSCHTMIADTPWVSPMPQKLQNIAKTLWLVFQREWMFGKGREILVGSEGQQNSTQSLRRNVRTWCVLFVCSIHFLFAMFAFFIYGVHFIICSSQFFSLQRFLFIRSDRLLFAAITFLFAAFFLF